MHAARALYAGGNSQDDLAAFGLPASAAKSFEDDACKVWPCNWKTVMLFVALQTQWRTGMGGATGLDYAAIPPTAKLSGIKLNQERFAGLRVMEQEALKVMGERAAAKRNNQG
jgi:hypothetical protein